MLKAALFLNGKAPKKIPNIKQYSQLFCTDGAYSYLKQLNIKPNAIIGDFDSISNIHILPEIIQIKDTNQDTTDFEKALQYITKLGIESIEIWGASGREQDHFLGNLSAALQYKNQIKIVFYDDHHQYFFLEQQDSFLTKVGKKVSFFPFPKADKVTANGLQYPVNQLDFELGKQIGTRNIATQTEVKVQFSGGNLIAFVQL